MQYGGKYASRWRTKPLGGLCAVLPIYQTKAGLTRINVNIQNETVWLSLDQMSELFQRDKSTISRHIKNIFSERELQRDSVVANFATTAADGKTYHAFSCGAGLFGKYKGAEKEIKKKK